jgi:gamma-tubulin complex component 3
MVYILSHSFLVINDSTLLQQSGNDTGWDVFYLHYHVDGPVATILTPNVMSRYGSVFSFLWKLKHAETALSLSWNRQMNCMLAQTKVPGISQSGWNELYP